MNNKIIYYLKENIVYNVVLFYIDLEYKSDWMKSCKEKSILTFLILEA